MRTETRGKFLTAAEFIRLRCPWFRVAVKKRRNGWDVWLRVDGAYLYQEDAKKAAEAMRELVMGIRELDETRMHDWFAEGDPL